MLETANLIKNVFFSHGKLPSYFNKTEENSLIIEFFIDGKYNCIEIFDNDIVLAYDNIVNEITIKDLIVYLNNNLNK